MLKISFFPFYQTGLQQPFFILSFFIVYLFL